MLSTLYPFAKKCLFRLSPERAHCLTLAALRACERLKLLGAMAGKPEEDPIELWGLRFPNRVGLAAGMDKDADTVDAFGRLGFGFIEAGTLTPRPQPGNPKPRLFRLISRRAFINRMGFNNEGVEEGVANIRRSSSFRGIIGVNIGKNKVTPNDEAVSDYLACMRAAWEVADYIAVNFSSPNTPGLRDLQQADAAARLLAGLKAEQANLASETGRNVPLLMKVAPDMEYPQIRDLSRVFLDGGLDGLIAANTTLSRSGVEDHACGHEDGGLSGAPLTRRAVETLQAFAAELGGQIPIIGVGGIMSPEDAVARIKAGAKLVQLYTGFVYGGPQLVSDCVKRLRTECPAVKGGQA
ncbi:MAG: quinone-dependent dihydroorotate dehydrogenase [Akkermansiaceae bacterium]|nr:quinone-dependent dihydroorotate dehydrogenase [Akkermansia sp.]MCD7799583.1 quinone-dependent dihydroorotate dehydrogenase [Akkermansiaceae bacterium]